MRIAVIGEYDANFPPHVATNTALGHSVAKLGLNIEPEWLSTAGLSFPADDALRDFAGLWIAPRSPYKSLAGALAAIRFARETQLPLLATCGGFQHVVIEYARNVLGIEDASHAEYDPYASKLFISRLTCSLVGKTLNIRILPGSQAERIYGAPTATESYYCNFGLNPVFQPQLDNGGLRVSGTDENGECRIFEIPSHPFFLATLFLPQLNSSADRPHPLVTTFLTAAGAKY